MSIAKETVSRETVKKKIHHLEFPKEKAYPEEKKEVDYLYMDANEDHVALQFRNPYYFWRNLTYSFLLSVMKIILTRPSFH